ncbi:unnamed protein product [[Candida] boidinii]|nr:unnamed protein product [[Candida] boidinii]
MGRRAKNKQGVPPTLDEFQSMKEKKQSKKDTKRKREEPSTDNESKPKKNAQRDHKKSNDSSSKKQKKQKATIDDVVEDAPDLPEVDLDELAAAKKSLFDDSDAEEEATGAFETLPDSEGDDEEEQDDEFYDSEEETREKPISCSRTRRSRRRIS